MNELAKAEMNDARAVAGQIRQGIHNYLATLALISRAYNEQHWRVLGYGDWQGYVDGEFGADRLRLPVEHRQKAVAELRLAGMSQRAIGSTLGVDEKTVRNDLRGAEFSAPDVIQGADGKTYAATRPDHPSATGEADARLAADRKAASEAPTGVGAPVEAGADEPARPRPPAWTPEERRQHEEDVRRSQDIDAARRTSQTVVPDFLSACSTIVAGSRYGEPDLVTKDMIVDLRKGIDLLEGEL